MFKSRIARARAVMEEKNVDTLMLSSGSDLPYFCGYDAPPLERITMLVVPRDDDATLVVPALEVARVRERPEVFSIRSWGDTEDPIAIIAELAGSATTAAVGDHMRAGFLVDLIGAMPTTSFGRASTITSPLRSVKESAEIERLREVSAAADQVAARLQNGEIELIGRTEAQVARDLRRQMIAAGHSRIIFTIVAAGENAASCHHNPTDRVIRANENVLCDFGGTLIGDDGVEYCSDITRNVWTGDRPDREYLEAYAVLHEAQAASVRAATVGTPAEDVDRVGRAKIAAAGYGSYFVHRTGHGIGVEVHEDPYIVEGNSVPLVAGNVFSIEPGIYIPGRWGMRLEDIVAATANGPDPLTTADHHLALVG